MALKSLGILTLDLIAKTGNFTGPIEKAKKKSKSDFASIEKYAKGMAKGLAVGVTAGAASLVLIVNRTRETIDAQAKLSDQLRTTYESLSTMSRAGELTGISFDQITNASKKLEINIGKAVEGSIAQADAFRALQLNAEEVSKLPLDKRIETINKALNQNVAASQRASVAAELYGAKAGIAIAQISPDTIAEAARQVEVFGLNLSELDAEKVEMANDAFSTIGMAADGISQQLTVQLAPALKAAGDRFLAFAEEAGGVDVLVVESIQKVVDSIEFVVNAIDGAGRVFSIVWHAISAGFDGVAINIGQSVKVIISALDAIPGVDMSQSLDSINRFIDDAKKSFNENSQALDEAINKPLAGTRFKKFFEDVKKEGDAAAEQSLKLKSAMQDLGNEAETFTEEQMRAMDALQKSFESIEAGYLKQIEGVKSLSEAEKIAYEVRSGKLVGINAEQQKRLEMLAEEVDLINRRNEVESDFADLTNSLKTDTEIQTDKLREQLDIIQQMKDLQGGGDYSEVTGRVIDSAFSDAPDTGTGGDSFGYSEDFAALDDKQAEIEDWYKTQLEMLDQFRSEKAELSAEWDEKELELKQEHENAIADIEMQRRNLAMTATSEMFGQMADTAKQFLGEQSSTYKALFALEKAYAIAKAVMNIPQSASDAYNAMVGVPFVGPVLAPIAAAAAVAAQAAQVASISSTNIGQAHDGIMSVPETGSWYLKKGERVTTAETSAKLDNTLDEVRRGNGRGGKVEQNIYVTGTIDNKTSSQLARDADRRQRISQERFGSVYR